MFWNLRGLVSDFTVIQKPVNIISLTNYGTVSLTWAWVIVDKNENRGIILTTAMSTLKRLFLNFLNCLRTQGRPVTAKSSRGKIREQIKTILNKWQLREGYRSCISKILYHFNIRFIKTVIYLLTKSSNLLPAVVTFWRFTRLSK